MVLTHTNARRRVRYRKHLSLAVMVVRGLLLASRGINKGCDIEEFHVGMYKKVDGGDIEGRVAS